MRNGIGGFGRFINSGAWGCLVWVVIFSISMDFQGSVIFLGLYLACRLGGRWLDERFSEDVQIDYSENGTVIGYKVLVVEPDQTVWSPMYPFLWRTGWNRAYKKRFMWDWDSSGFYAFRDLSMAKACGTHRRNVIVKMEMAGRVAVCEKGYRSEYARVVEVLTPSLFIRRDLSEMTDILFVGRK